VLLAACGGSGAAQLAAPTAAATTSAPASPTPVDSAAPTGSPLPGGSSPAAASESPEPSVDSHAAPELEALLPAKVGDVQLERLSLSGADFYATGLPETQSRLDAMLTALGKTVADLSVADAGDPFGRTVLEIGAFRVAGAKPAQLLSEWVSSNQASNPGNIAVSNETVDGRRLTKLVDRSLDVRATTWVYVKGDTIFLIGADDPALVSAALAQLPTP
jgi:hypothetical protein